MVGRPKRQQIEEEEKKGRMWARPQGRMERRRVCASGAVVDDVWALDFDGVACDSCGESSLSAWKVRLVEGGGGVGM